MIAQPQQQYPVFVMCGSDLQRRRLLKVIDPEGKYKSKALLPFLGKRLMDWQLGALSTSPYIEGLYLIGLSEADAQFDFPVHYVPIETSSEFLDKLLTGLDYLASLGKDPELVVISTCDTPGIRAEDINTFFEQLNARNGEEFLLSLVPEDLIEAVFPGSRRVVIRFRDYQLIPGEMYALSPRAIHLGKEFIAGISQRRRQINRQEKKINPAPVIRLLAKKPLMWGVILKYLLGAASLADAERAITRSFDCKSKAVIIPDAGFGMDMDLPEDYQRLEAYVQTMISNGN
jgi:hypothetical protein